jgi:hypothetical protein
MLTVKSVKLIDPKRANRSHGKILNAQRFRAEKFGAKLLLLGVAFRGVAV